MTTLVKLNNAAPVFNSFFDDYFKRDVFSGFNLNKVSTNIQDTASAYLLELVAPGFKKDHFSLSIENDYLKIRGKVENENTDGESNTYTVKEYHKSSFEKSFKLPKEVNQDQISAKYEDGILHIEIPKKSKEETKTQKVISVN